MNTRQNQSARIKDRVISNLKCSSKIQNNMAMGPNGKTLTMEMAGLPIVMQGHK
jgi:hypothetical protein